MLAALLDKRITIEIRTDTKNTFGASEENWATLKIIWASKKHLSGDKIFSDGDLTTRAIEWRLRYDAEIGMNCRINEDGDIYEIKEIEEVGRKRELLIRTEKNGG